MIRLTPIKNHNIGTFALRVEVREDQQHLGNFNFAQRLGFAYADWATTGKQPFVFGIAHGEKTPVGVLIISYATAEEGEYVNGDLECYYIDVLYIDKNHQGKGYAKEALKEAIKFIKTFPHGEAKSIYSDTKPKNEGMLKTFASVGFVETDDSNENDIVVRFAL